MLDLYLNLVSHLQGATSTRQDSIHWVEDVQSHLQEDERFHTWRQQLDLFIDGDGVWRCGGRMSRSCISAAEQNPILLDKKTPPSYTGGDGGSQTCPSQ